MEKQKKSDLKQNLSENTSITKEEVEKYGPIIKRKVIETFVKHGLLDIKDMTDTEITVEMLKLIEDAEFNFILDYKDSILKQARLFYREDKVELSCLLYATWFEHWINEIISILGNRKNLNENEINEIIRHVSFRGKYTWLLKLFDFKEINKAHINLIFRLTDLRNSFVHYKWKEKNNDFKNEEKFVIEKIEKTVKYIRNIENRYVYNNSKRKLSNL
ncbi:hypothetical protein [Clostridium beijerinckii]|uniref:hypothetical protein n=1 Tax=Clostridium beijerinckii TaxID=1520 RepID=UPI001361556E|nr:hypothetical protein [Clostridium beijerinckii]MZK50967.1 hypothetical protein [Clostridium beijerinckii]MZK59169.1 hypothetical protein [Clostridium beijerinckii]MZK69288.1 hypothetical protein [Clostridium beijerinckii]MZK74661.1 hypothetical protein [Clostridium beijerinckii]MZK84380.1 hypothetical protein [Clostridium beijerinckii]